MRLPHRQKRMLALLDALGGEANNLDFQKYLFLYCQEQAPVYDFVPSKFGAFSYTSHADRRKLVEHGLLQTDDDRWALTPAAAAIVESERSPELNQFARQYKQLRGEALVRETYCRFPYYAIRSTIAYRILRNNPGARRAIRSARPSAGASGGLFTIGYEGRSLEQYLNLLVQAGVGRLTDVRRNALSRKYGFSRSSLQNACAGVGIEYEHIPELGIDSSERRDLIEQADYDALFSRYRKETLPAQSSVLNRLLKAVESGDRLALTCFEHNVGQCHRGCVAHAVQRRSNGAINTRHL